MITPLLAAALKVYAIQFDLFNTIPIRYDISTQCFVTVKGVRRLFSFYVRLAVVAISGMHYMARLLYMILSSKEHYFAMEEAQDPLWILFCRILILIFSLFTAFMKLCILVYDDDIVIGWRNCLIMKKVTTKRKMIVLVL